MILLSFSHIIITSIYFDLHCQYILTSAPVRYISLFIYFKIQKNNKNDLMQSNTINALELRI